VFDELIGDAKLDSDQIAALRAKLHSTGAVAKTEELIALSRDESLSALIELGVDASVELELRSLVDAITVRNV
jgi:geranylgeranyl pyrophosphate synthase